MRDSLLKKILSRLKRLLLVIVYKPVVLFDPFLYREKNQLSGLFFKRPLLHYFFFAGVAQRKNAYPLFDYDYFSAQLQQRGLKREGDFLKAYLSDKSLWSLSPHILFDTHFYCAQLAEPPKRAPLLDYYLKGAEAPDPHPLFSQQWYLERNKHIKSAIGFAGSSALSHFQMTGHKQGELPHPYFHTIWYANTFLNGDRISHNPLMHYLEGGYQSNSPSRLFNAQRYRESHQLQNEEEPLQHYLARNPLQLPAKRNRLTDMFWPAVSVADNRLTSSHEVKKELVILFTPRSGSTWLTGLLKKTQKLGHPAEWFNFRLVNEHCAGIKYYPESLGDYVSAIRSQRASDNGVFSVEISEEHLVHLQAEGELNDLFPAARYCFLYREGVVAQAISLYLAVQSGFFNSSQSANRKHQPDYDAQKILYWVKNVVDQENLLLDYLKAANIKAHFITYESLSDNPLETVKALLGYMEEEVDEQTLNSLLADQKQRIANTLNEEYIQRLQREEQSALQAILSKRHLNT